MRLRAGTHWVSSVEGLSNPGWARPGEYVPQYCSPQPSVTGPSAVPAGGTARYFCDSSRAIASRRINPSTSRFRQLAIDVVRIVQAQFVGDRRQRPSEKSDRVTHGSHRHRFERYGMLHQSCRFIPVCVVPMAPLRQILTIASNNL